MRQRCRVSYVTKILAYSWARPAILAAGKGSGGMFLSLLFLHFNSFSWIDISFNLNTIQKKFFYLHILTEKST